VKLGERTENPSPFIPESSTEKRAVADTARVITRGNQSATNPWKALRTGMDIGRPPQTEAGAQQARLQPIRYKADCPAPPRTALLPPRAACWVSHGPTEPEERVLFLWQDVEDVRGRKTATRDRSDIRGQVRRVLLTPHEVTNPSTFHYGSLGCRRKKVRTKPSNDLV